MKEYEMGNTHDMMGTTFTILVRKPAEWTTWETQASMRR
jgi:hypothetical protein